MASGRGFDDDDDADTGGDPPEPRRGRGADRQTGGTQDGNRKKGGGQRREIDLASDGSFIWRLIKTNVSAAANDIGRAGYDVGPIKTALDVAEKVLGPRLTAQGLNVLAALVQNPDMLKSYLRALGLPEQVNGLIDEFIDDLFEGLRMGMRDGHNKLDEQSQMKAEKDALGKLRGKLGSLEIKTFEQAQASLSQVEQDQLYLILRGFSPEQRKTFDAYRTKLAASGRGGIKAFIRIVFAAPAAGRAAEAVTYLESTYGTLAKPATATTVVDKTVKTVKEFFGAVQKHIPAPDAAQQAAADARRTHTQQHIEDTKAARKNRSW